MGYPAGMFGPVISAPRGWLIQHLLLRLGFREDGFLLIVAILRWHRHRGGGGRVSRVDLATAQLLYRDFGPGLYDRWIWLLIAWPAAGGLAVGVLSRVVFRAREGTASSM